MFREHGKASATLACPTILKNPRGVREAQPPSKRQGASASLAEGTKIPGDVKVACPTVNRIVVVRVHAGKPAFRV